MQPVHGLASGLWSSSGLEMAIDGKNIVRESPDGSVSIRETDGGLMVTYMKNEILSDVVFLPIMTEIIWSPYGGSFVVSGSDGGSVGTWGSLYYFINSDGSINSINIENIISSYLRDFPKCDDVETANFGAVRWVDKRLLLLVVEAPPHSSCKNMGSIEGIVVDLANRRVVRKIKDANLRKKWKSMLGSHFN